jgi:hypothetical protein
MNSTRDMKIEVPQNQYSYTEYQQLIKQLLDAGKVTGDQQSDSLLEYTKLNLHRMHRWDKTFLPQESLVKRVRDIKEPLFWIVITEGWCGDAAQQLSVIDKLASFNTKIKLRYVLRDENPSFMDLFLTNGSRAIPIWLCLNSDGELLWKWGPRPKEAADLLQKLKDADVDDSTRKQELHSWYAKNKHLAFQSEIEQLLAHHSE